MPENVSGLWFEARRRKWRFDNLGMESRVTIRLTNRLERHYRISETQACTNRQK